MQNQAAVMHGTHDVRLEDLPVPHLIRLSKQRVAPVNDEDGAGHKA